MPTTQVRADELTDEARKHVDAVIELVTDHDTLDFRVADVVRVAGSCNAAFYRAFTSKDELVLAASRETSKRTMAAFRRSLPPDPTPTQVVTAWVTQLLRHASTRRHSRAARAFALDRYRLARQFPSETADNARILQEPLAQALAAAGVADRGLVLESIVEMVLSLQAAHIASNRTFSPRKIKSVAGLCVRMAGLPAD